MVIWTEPAKNDLHNIYNYIAYDSIFYAKKVVADIVEKTEYLKDNSNLGTIVQELKNKSVRQLLSYDYRIIYENIGNNSYILTIIRSKCETSKHGFPLLDLLHQNHGIIKTHLDRKLFLCFGY